jgi:hypothetical protein
MSDLSPITEILAGPTPTAAKTSQKWPRWLVPIVIGALVLGLAGLGVGIYAVATTPAKVSGPQGPVGPQGVTGPQGPQGPKGEPGHPGTIAATSIVAAATVTSSPDAPVGTVLVAKASCPAGKVLLSGGAEVSASSTQADRKVELLSSFPSSTTEWQTVAIVTRPLGAGVAMIIKPYVLCGTAASTTT